MRLGDSWSPRSTGAKRQERGGPRGATVEAGRQRSIVTAVAAEALEVEDRLTIAVLSAFLAALLAAS